ncbi:phospholipase D family protein [Burkholderia multivorans]|uniref:phospholipase D family protein n=1 Tax=Burkholderia multivorans TaxID=87883 RepID=UPI0021C23357|nr:phospholipase D family protein [Burkholderia multivorans]
MKLISSSTILESNLIRLIKTYPNIAFGVAWASASTIPYDLLLKHKSKVKVGIIGTHFYQTHPDVLDSFIESKSVKFVLQPRGVFHPKLYLFWNANEWECIIGSANFTAGALGENTELCTLLSHEGGDHLDDLRDLIKSYAVEAKSLTAEEATNYRRIWKAKQPDLRKLGDQYGAKPSSKPAVQSEVMSMDWPTFLAELRKDKTHGFDERLDLLAKIRHALASKPHFMDLDPGTRRAIAGIPNDVMEHSAWFGSMKGAGTFKNLVIANPKHLSVALDKIPFIGVVTKNHYDAYISEFKEGFPGKGYGIATATRLLSMKRPDQFLCVLTARTVTS